MKAKDKAAENLPIDPQLPFKYITYVTVKEFLECLYGPDVLTKIAASTTAAYSTRAQTSKNENNYFENCKKSFKRVLDSYINFTHFFETNTNISFSKLKSAVKVTQAIKCKKNAKTIDYVIPCVLDLNGDLEDENISCIIVQVKLYTNPINWSANLKDLSLDCFYDAPQDHPSLSLFVEFGEKANDPGELSFKINSEYSGCIYSRSIKMFKCFIQKEADALKTLINTLPRIKMEDKECFTYNNYFKVSQLWNDLNNE